jgi:hypothetical protein
MSNTGAHKRTGAGRALTHDRVQSGEGADNEVSRNRLIMARFHTHRLQDAPVCAVIWPETFDFGPFVFCIQFDAGGALIAMAII